MGFKCGSVHPVIARQTRLLYVDPKKYSCFSFAFGDRKRKSIETADRFVLSIFLYFLPVNFSKCFPFYHFAR